MSENKLNDIQIVSFGDFIAEKNHCAYEACAHVFNPQKETKKTQSREGQNCLISVRRRVFHRWRETATSSSTRADFLFKKI